MGYGEARVVITTVPTSQGHVNVRVDVVPGPKWHLAKLAFLGAKRLALPDLRAAAALEDGSVYTQDRVDAASLRLTDLFMDRGLMRAQMAEKRDIAEDGGVTITWTITEGDVFIVREVKLEGLAAASAKELNPKLALKPKAPFSRALSFDDQTRIHDFFSARGEDVLVTPAMKVDEAKKTVDLAYNVASRKSPEAR